jgi:hypothetical protein
MEKQTELNCYITGKYVKDKYRDGVLLQAKRYPFQFPDLPPECSFLILIVMFAYPSIA